MRRARVSTALSLAALAAACFGIAAPRPASAQTAGLDQLQDWNIEQVQWRSEAGLPGDNEFTGPITAAYNWAYGATILGLNVHAVGSKDYYAAFAVLQNGVLDSLDVAGPLTGPVQWDSGPYHLAAGLPDGRIIIWLTAPREYPQLLTYTIYYEPGTAFDFAVYPPNPVDATWTNWWVTGAYQYSVFEPSLVVATINGAGQQSVGLSALNLSGDLKSLAYMDYPVASGTFPYVAYTTVLDPSLEMGGNEHLQASGAWFSQTNGWYRSDLRDAGLYNGDVLLMTAQSPLGILVYDESDRYSISSSLLQFAPTSPDGAQLQTNLGLSCYVPVVVKGANCCLFGSVRSAFPLVAFSEGTDVYLGYYLETEARTSQLNYYFPLLYQGDQVDAGGQPAAAYPIFAMAASAHWSTGNPEIFWVQRGSRNNNYNALYRLAYEPRTR